MSSRTVRFSPSHGVLVTVDPHRHPDTEALFSRLKLSLSQPPVNPVTPKLEKHRP